jgi:hypothetical protein
MSQLILLGYAIALITLGLQAFIFYCGQIYIGVSRDWVKLTQFSSAYVPLLSAFVLSLRSSFNEEIIFRLFGISLLRRYLRTSILAIILTSIAWGLGHTGYAVFPIWFRIIEVSLIGIFYGFIFLRYGIIPVIVGHFLFDAFLGSAAYILGKSQPQLYFGSIGMLCIPFIVAILAYCLNKQEKERDPKTLLNKIQEYNLKILIAFISAQKSQGTPPQRVKEELLKYNWDHALVVMALAEVFGTQYLDIR